MTKSQTLPRALRTFFGTAFLFSLVMVIAPRRLPFVAKAQTNVGIGGPAYGVLNARTSQNQSQFFVYQDIDSGFNHGFPSGLFGSSQTAMSKLHLDPGCVFSASAANGCSTDPTAMDQTRGTVFRFSFDPLSAGESVGLNFEE